MEILAAALKKLNALDVEGLDIEQYKEFIKNS